MVIGCVQLTDVTDVIQYGRHRIIGNGVLPRVERTAERKDFELILTVKMETRHPV